MPTRPESAAKKTAAKKSATKKTAASETSQDVLSRFSAATRAWFTGAFAAPTPAQTQAWDAISSGAHTLVVAPTGSGKTLSAFLWSLDRLFHERLSRSDEAASSDTPSQDTAEKPACRVLYISPLKALAVDVERNLRSPLVGIEQAAARMGQSVPSISVATRSGDTPAAERRAFAKRPSDILITTPESLFLLLTSAARESLRGVETVIIDEIHAVAGTKRGAHLAVSLARLDELLERPAQRIGLSATVRPVEEVAGCLAGGRDVTIVQPEADKSWDLQVHVPVPDLGELGGSPAAPTAAAADWSPTSEPDPTRRASIWPHVEERIVDLVAAHRSTLVFVNSRRLAERLTARLNELWEERLEAAQQDPDDPGDGVGAPAAVSRTPRVSAPPAQMLGSGVSHGAPGILARAHHGSVSKEARAAIEDDLKSGRLPAVVATSSLELGIDMGAVDLVIQVESPPSVAGALQRVGRAGHQVGATSRGIFFPKFRGDLVQTSVVAERMRQGQIEAIHPPRNPLDVLAQQIVAMCAVDDWSVEDLLRVLRSASPYATLSRTVLDSVLDMLAGRYPSEEFAELRPRIVWDRVNDSISGRPGALRLAVTSGGTIPDRGLYGVFLAGGGGPGRRVGELDEEMVYESRVGDVFTLGTSSWRIEDITHDQVLVTPAPGAPGRLPFWKGDTLGRGSELGAAVGRFVGQLSTLPQEQARDRITEAGLDEWAADNLLGYLTEQREATGRVPDDTHLVIERFRDELGDWRIVLHSPFGAQVHAPWALCISTRMQDRFGFDVQAMHGDDGIVLRLPDVEFDDDPDRDWAADVAEAILPSSEEVTELVTSQVAGSALFASRFRECAARSLLLPRRQPGRRQALWQQRQRAMQLLSVASNYPTFPVVLEAVRECVQDVYDVPGLKDLLARIEQGSISVTHLQTESASPFARSLMFGYVAQFLYEGDSPLAERRAAALSLDPGLLAELLGTDGSLVRDLLDPQAVLDIETELQGLSPERRARHAEDVSDLLRRLGPLSAAEVAARTRDDVAEQVPDWLAGLQSARRIIEVRIAGEQRWASVEDAGSTARRARGRPAGRHPRGLPRRRRGSVARPPGSARGNPRAVHSLPGGDPVRHRRGRGARESRRARHRRPALTRAAAAPGTTRRGRPRPRLQRCPGAAAPQAAIARRPARRARTGRAGGVRALPARVAGDPRSAARRGRSLRGDRAARWRPSAGERPGNPRPAAARPRLRAAPARRAPRLGGRALAGTRTHPRRRPLGVAASHRDRPPHAQPSGPGARARRRPPGAARHPRRWRQLLLPGAEPAAPGARHGGRRRAAPVGSRRGRARHRRRLRGGARAARGLLRRPPVPQVGAARAPGRASGAYGRWTARDEPQRRGPRCARLARVGRDTRRIDGFGPGLFVGLGHGIGCELCRGLGGDGRGERSRSGPGPAPARSRG